MAHEFFWPLVVLVWIFGWATIWYLRRNAVESRSLKQRELLHRERMAAIDKGVPLPEIPADEEMTPAWLRPEAERMRAAWLWRMALVLGLLALFTGIGMCAGFYWAPDRNFHAMWSIGMIPAMAGVGLLLYVALAPKPGAD
jgi:hypothetical protein